MDSRRTEINVNSLQVFFLRQSYDKVAGHDSHKSHQVSYEGSLALNSSDKLGGDLVNILYFNLSV